MLQPASEGIDPLLLMARKTDWSDHGNGLFIGRGQRHWQTDAGISALFETRVILFDNPIEAKTDKPTAAGVENG